MLFGLYIVNIPIPTTRTHIGFILTVRASDNYVNGSSTEHGPWECLSVNTSLGGHTIFCSTPPSTMHVF